MGCLSNISEKQLSDDSSLPADEHQYIVQSLSINEGIQSVFVLDATDGRVAFELTSEQIDTTTAQWLTIDVLGDQGIGNLDLYDEPDFSLTHNWVQAQFAPTGELVVLVNDVVDQNPYVSHFLIMDMQGVVQYIVKAPFAHHSFDFYQHQDGSWSLAYVKAEPRHTSDFPELTTDRRFIVGDQVVWVDLQTVEAGQVMAEVKWSAFDALMVREDSGVFYGADMIDWTHMNSLMIDQQSNALSVSLWTLHSLLLFDIDNSAGDTISSLNLRTRRGVYSTRINKQMFEQHPNYDGYQLSQVDFMNPHGVISSNSHQEMYFMDNSKAEAVSIVFDSAGTLIEEYRIRNDYPVIAFGNALEVGAGVVVNWGGPFIEAPCIIELLDLQLQTKNWRYQVEPCEDATSRPFLGYSKVVPEGISVE